MKDIIAQMEKGNDVAQNDLQKVARKLVRFFKSKGFEDVSQDTRKNTYRYILIRIKGNVSEEVFKGAAEICPPTKTHVQQPDGTHIFNYWSYFSV